MLDSAAIFLQSFALEAGDQKIDDQRSMVGKRDHRPLSSDEPGVQTIHFLKARVANRNPSRLQNLGPEKLLPKNATCSAKPKVSRYSIAWYDVSRVLM